MQQSQVEGTPAIELNRAWFASGSKSRASLSITRALSHNSRLAHDGPSPRLHQATRTIAAVPKTEKRFMSTTRMEMGLRLRSGLANDAVAIYLDRISRKAPE
jgi:hypothetical protein